MSLKTWGWVFGVVFIVIGLLGFVPGAVTPDGMLFGILSVDTMSSVVYMISGILAIAAIWGAGTYAQLYFKVFGVIYALIMLVGFVQGSTVLGLMTTNMADNVLNLVIAGIALWLGFGMKNAGAAPMSSGPTVM